MAEKKQARKQQEQREEQQEEKREQEQPAAPPQNQPQSGDPEPQPLVQQTPEADAQAEEERAAKRKEYVLSNDVEGSKRFTVRELLQRPDLVRTVPGHVMAGALYGRNDDDELTLDEAVGLVNESEQREVKRA